MKTLFFLAAWIFCLGTHAQTKAIAHKSHSGSDQSFDAEAYADNFGVIAPRIKKIKYLKDNCIVEFPEWGGSDTVCDHPYFTGQYTLDEIKAFYPKEVQFIGFEGKFFNKAIPPPGEKKNSLYFFMILFFLGGASF